MKAMKVFGLLICAVALLGVLTAAAPIRPAPPAGGFNQMAYDTNAKLIILYGGISGDNVLDPSTLNCDTWTFDPARNVWTKMSPAVHPGGSHGGYMVYDSKADRMIMSIRNDDTWSPTPETALQTWAYDVKKDTWTQLADGPRLMIGQRLAYDSESDRIILFGGLPIPPNPAFRFLAETWVYDYNTNTWTNMRPKVHPLGINFMGMVYDSKADRVVMWGDWSPNYNPSAEAAVWTYDYNTNTWQAFEHKKDGPSVRDYNNLAYDEAADKIIMYGGYPWGNDETWVYDLNADAWQQMLPATNPGPLSAYSMVYARDVNRTILFGGGSQVTLQFKTDTWSYDLGANTWSLVYPGR
jgi:hypothetical protein